jgi:hypothetical protein
MSINDFLFICLFLVLGTVEILGSLPSTIVFLARLGNCKIAFDYFLDQSKSFLVLFFRSSEKLESSLAPRLPRMWKFYCKSSLQTIKFRLLICNLYEFSIAEGFSIACNLAGPKWVNVHWILSQDWVWGDEKVYWINQITKELNADE